MKDALGDRMKDHYEDRTRIKLGRRTNTLIRIDGKAFHTYTRGLNKPYDTGLLEDMNETTKFLCENIQGAKMGYVQSDEISIWITDYDDLSTSAWFDNNLQKMCSVAASLATAKFNQLRMARFCKNNVDPMGSLASSIVDQTMNPEEIEKFKLAMFDARVFQISYIDEVVNYFIWRQQDATRNSISMAAQSMFSHKELQGKKASDMQDMMMLQKSVNWNDYPTRFKRGAAIVKVENTYRRKKGETGPGVLIDPVDVVNAKQAIATLGDQSSYEIYSRTNWAIDNEIPVFTQDREFVKNQITK